MATTLGTNDVVITRVHCTLFVKAGHYLGLTGMKNKLSYLELHERTTGVLHVTYHLRG